MEVCLIASHLSILFVQITWKRTDTALFEPTWECTDYSLCTRLLLHPDRI